MTETQSFPDFDLDAHERRRIENYALLSIQPCVSLTTFRRVGTPVPTPVWTAPYAGRLLVWTGANSGKVKRIRHTPEVRLAPCDIRGRLTGEPVPAYARIMGPEEMPVVVVALEAKYGWRFRLSRWGAALGRLGRLAPRGQVGLELILR